MRFQSIAVMMRFQSRAAMMRFQQRTMMMIVSVGNIESDQRDLIRSRLLFIFR